MSAALGALAHVVRRLGWLLVLMELIALFGHLGSRLWLADIASHFRMQYVALGTVFLILATVARTWNWAGLALAVVLHNGLMLAPFLPADREVPGEIAIKLLSANVLSGNSRHGELARLIRAEDPDVIVLTEITDGWIESLQPVLSAYGHRLVKPRRDNFGISIHSRIPLLDARLRWLGPAQIESVEAVIMHPLAEPVRILGVHPLPPWRPDYKKLRDAQLRDTARHIAGTPGHWIVAGDLNTTMYAPIHAEFEEVSGLRNFRYGYGIHPTWPSDTPVLGVPIDHIHTGPTVGVAECRVTRSIGSDHLPLVATLMLPRKVD